MRRHPPLGERDFGALEYGAHGDGELALALVAVPKTGTMALLLALDLGERFRVPIAAMRANGTVRPSQGFESLTGLVFALKDRVLKRSFCHGLSPIG